ncbi:hypothetical protein GCM10019017_72550 [Streptomyces showdoensis]
MSSARSGGRVLAAYPGDPKRVGAYRIIGRLGSGGVGTVFAGLDAAGLRVAVKVVHPAQADDAEFRARFRREVQLSARVQGPCSFVGHGRLKLALVRRITGRPAAARRPWTCLVPGLRRRGGQGLVVA